MYICICVYISLSPSLSLYIYMYMYMYVCVCIYIYIYIYTHAHMSCLRFQNLTLQKTLASPAVFFFMGQGFLRVFWRLRFWEIK